MSVSYKELYYKRCVKSGDKMLPTFWKAPHVKREPFGFWGSTDMPVPEDWGVEQVMQTMIGMGLMLELPVGEFIREGMKGELPVEKNEGIDYVKKLFLTNSADEGKHYEGMVKAAKAYPVSEDLLRECESLRDAWLDLPIHPILKAGTLESSIFLAGSLAFARLFGSPDIATMARGISGDERRHVVTNRYAVIDLGIDPWNPGKQTVDLVIDSFNLLLKHFNPTNSEEVLGIEVNRDFFIEAGLSLLSTGEAPILDNLVRTVDYNPAFEIGNAALYDRVIEKELVPV